MRLISVLLTTATIFMNSYAQMNSLGMFEGQADVGKVSIGGSEQFDASTQMYTVSGSGANMWFDRDAFHFIWIRLKGDFLLSARANFVGKGVEQHRKLGWIIRSTLDGNSRNVNASLHGDGLMSLQYRRQEGDSTREVRSPVKGPDVIQLERKGETYLMSVARFGDTLSTVRVDGIKLGEDVYVGLFVCSHNDTVKETAEFRNVRITIPPREGFVPYKDYIGSDLETLDLESGNRIILYHSPVSIQAPNWTPDGKTLIYNSDGLLYRFDLASGKPSVLPTGFATANNNDHVLSFDGTMIGISHHSKDDDNRSIIYTLPVTGGTPKRITEKGPSYLHGWTPDGSALVYTAERNGQYDIYRIPSAGGAEVRLTDAPGLDDGPEYAPDGKQIYFNSNRTGKMQIWRMNPDGSGQQQVTRDEFNNWFPHLSPDGKWIIFLTFGPEVNPGDHPFYKKVYLRMMPASGGPARVVAYVYGGQGTMNVPSWSPDGKKIAFVSNTDLK